MNRKMRISKREFYARGGFSRSDQYRKHNGTAYTYWRLVP